MSSTEPTEDQLKSLLFNTRNALDLSTAEAGQLVGVTARSWENWERRPGVNIPKAKFELFCLKASGEYAEFGMRHSLPDSDPGRELVTVTTHVGRSPYPIDVIAGSNFLSYEDNHDGTAVIRSLAVDPSSYKPYVRSTTFEIATNKHVVRACERWRSALDL